jgi:hypothetical protein
MEPDPLDQLYRQPLLVNAVLLLIPGLSYWYMRTHLVSYGRDMVEPELGASLFFIATFALFPVVNLLCCLRALLYSHTRLAIGYALLTLFLFLGVYQFYHTQLAGFHKMGG